MFILNSKDSKGKIPQIASKETGQTNAPIVESQQKEATIVPQIKATTPPKVVQSTFKKRVIPPLVAKAGTAPPQYFDAHEEEEGEKAEDKARSVGERLQFEFDMLKNPVTGKIPRLARETAIEAAVAAASYEPLWGAESIPGLTLTPKGPTNLGGKTRALALMSLTPTSCWRVARVLACFGRRTAALHGHA